MSYSYLEEVEALADRRAAASQKAVDRLTAIMKDISGDMGDTHQKADAVLLEFITEIGYENLAVLWSLIPKRYV